MKLPRPGVASIVALGLVLIAIGAALSSVSVVGNALRHHGVRL